MIAQIHPTSSIAKTLHYISREGSELIAGDLIGGSAKERARVMREVCLDGHPKLKHEGIHIILSLAPGQHLTPQQWEHAIRKVLRGLGMADSLWEAHRHQDGAGGCEHIHMVATARDQSGKRIERRNDRLKAQRVCRELEAEFGFPQVSGGPKAARRKRPPSPADPGVIAEMRRRVGRFVGARGMDRCYTFAQFAQALRQVGVELVPKTRAGKVVGLGYRMGGTYIRAGDLHKDFTFGALRRSGLQWDPVRDWPVITQGGHHATPHPHPKPHPECGPAEPGPHAFERGWVRSLIAAGIDPARARRIAAEGRAAGGPGKGAAGDAPRRNPGPGGHGGTGPGRAR